MRFSTLHYRCRILRLFIHNRSKTKYMKKRIFLPFLICLLFFSVSETFSQQTPFVKISGTVSRGNIIMPFVRVTVRNARGNFSREDRTNNQGFFKFLRLPRDNYFVEAEIPGVRWIRSFPKINGTKNIEIDFDVDTDPGSISGKVTDDSDEKKPVENLKITLIDEMEPEDKQDVPVKPDGSYEISELVQGKYRLIFEAPGYKTKEKDVNVKGKGEKKHEKVDVKLDKKSQE